MLGEMLKYRKHKYFEQPDGLDKSGPNRRRRRRCRPWRSDPTCCVHGSCTRLSKTVAIQVD